MILNLARELKVQMRLLRNMLQISNACMPKHIRIETVELSKKTLCEDSWMVCEIMRPALKSNIIKSQMTLTRLYITPSTLSIENEEVLMKPRKEKKFRDTQGEQENPSDDEEAFGTDEEDNRALRVPSKSDKPLPKKTNRVNLQGEQAKTDETGQIDSMKMITETRDLVQTLVNHLTNQDSSNTGKKNQLQANAGFSRRGKVQCYACQEFGHMARDCPSRLGKSGSNTGSGRGNTASLNRGEREAGINL